MYAIEEYRASYAKKKAHPCLCYQSGNEHGISQHFVRYLRTQGIAV